MTVAWISSKKKYQPNTEIPGHLFHSFKQLLVRCRNSCGALVTFECARKRETPDLSTYLWFILLITSQLISENPITGQMRKHIENDLPPGFHAKRYSNR